MNIIYFWAACAVVGIVAAVNLFRLRLSEWRRLRTDGGLPNRRQRWIAIENLVASVLAVLGGIAFLVSAVLLIWRTSLPRDLVLQWPYAVAAFAAFGYTAIWVWRNYAYYRYVHIAKEDGVWDTARDLRDAAG